MPQSADFVYELNDQGNLIIKEWVGTGKHLVIPSEIDNKQVWKVDAQVFEGPKSAVIPSGVEVTATSSTTLKNVEIIFDGSNTEVGIFLPFCKPLETVFIAEGITALPGFFAQGCKSLKHVSFPSTLKTIGYEAFWGCESLALRELPEGLEIIGERAFDKCKSITELRVPASVTSFGEWCLPRGASYEDWYVKIVCEPGSAAEKFVLEEDDGCDIERCIVHCSTVDGAGQKSEGCYIATAVYGSYDCPQVWTLRRFRDQGLRRTSFGRKLVSFYYSVSPKLVERFSGCKSLTSLVRKALDSMTAALMARGYSDKPYYDNIK